MLTYDSAHILALTLLHSELYTVLSFLSAIGLKELHTHSITMVQIKRSS